MGSSDLTRFSGSRALASLAVVAGVLLAAAVLGDLPTGLGRRGTPALVAAALVSLVGLLGVFAAVDAVPAYLRLQRYEAVDTGAMTGEAGRVALRGTVQPSGRPVTSLLSETDIVARSVRVSTAPFDGGDTVDYTVHTATERATRFTIDDGTGVTTVDATDADVSLSEATRRTFPPTRDLPGPVAAHLDEIGTTVDTDTRRARIEERVLRSEEAAFVAGESDEQFTADLVADEDYASRLRSRIARYGGGGSVVASIGVLGVLVLAGVV